MSKRYFSSFLLNLSYFFFLNTFQLKICCYKEKGGGGWEECQKGRNSEKNLGLQVRRPRAHRVRTDGWLGGLGRGHIRCLRTGGSVWMMLIVHLMWDG